MKRAFLLFAIAAPLALAAMPADARTHTAPPGSERRVISLVVYGDDACPVENPDEIVVCARRPEKERYRIPKALRQDVVPVGTQGWGARAAAVDADARRFIPGSCSPVGANGQTGCTRAALTQWYWDRRQSQQQAAIP